MLCPNCGAPNDGQAYFCGECGRDLRAHVVSPPTVEEEHPVPLDPVVQTKPERDIDPAYAGFWVRFFAFAIDTVFLFLLQRTILSFESVLYPYYYYPLSNYSGLTDNEIGIFLILIMVPIAWFYFSILESSGPQSTIGKRAIGIKVTDLHGNRISFWRATIRYFAKFISILLICFGFFMIAFTKKKRGLHDMIAGSLVLKTTFQ